MNNPSTLHSPVLPNEALEQLRPRLGDWIIDATLGLAGHSELILQKIGPTGLLIGIDQDEQSLKLAKERLKKFPNVVYVHDNFENLKEIAEEVFRFKKETHGIQGILFDLGFSSLHVDQGDRGFSFQKNGPLDMRLDQRIPITAAEILNQWPLKTLTNLFKTYGEEPHSQLIAQAIVRQRKVAPLAGTVELADLVRRTVWGPTRIHPATRIFQALRIVVNHEMEALEKGLEEAIHLVSPGGRIAVIAFHSLEDRIVKNIFRTYAHREEPPTLSLVTKKIILPTEEEMQQNPRSRSAKLRAAQRIL